MKHKTLILGSMLISGFFAGEPVFPQSEESESEIVAEAGEEATPDETTSRETEGMNRAERIRLHEKRIQEIMAQRRAAAEQKKNAVTPKPTPEAPLKGVLHFATNREAVDLIGAASFLFDEVEDADMPADDKTVVLKVREENVRVFTELMALLDVKEPPAPDASRFDHLSVQEADESALKFPDVLDSPVSLAMNEGRLVSALAIVRSQVPVQVHPSGSAGNRRITILKQKAPLRDVLDSICEDSDLTWWSTVSPEPTILVSTLEWYEQNFIPTINGDVYTYSYDKNVRETLTNFFNTRLSENTSTFFDLQKPQVMLAYSRGAGISEVATDEILPERLLVQNENRNSRLNPLDETPVTIAMNEGRLSKAAQILETQLNGKKIKVTPNAADIRTTLLAKDYSLSKVFETICSSLDLVWWIDQEENYVIGFPSDIPDSLPNNPHKRTIKSYQSANYPMSDFVEVARKLHFLKERNHIYDEPTGQLIVLDSNERQEAIKELQFVLETYSEKAGK